MTNPSAPTFAPQQTPAHPMVSLTEGPLSARELGAVSSVIAYIAYSQQVGQGAVARVLASAMGVRDLKEIGRDRYDDAIRFLVQLRLDQEQRRQ